MSESSFFFFFACQSNNRNNSKIFKITYRYTEYWKQYIDAYNFIWFIYYFFKLEKQCRHEIKYGKINYGQCLSPHYSSTILNALYTFNLFPVYPSGISYWILHSSFLSHRCLLLVHTFLCFVLFTRCLYVGFFCVSAYWFVAFFFGSCRIFHCLTFI